jgi:hypothetical protein
VQEENTVMKKNSFIILALLFITIIVKGESIPVEKTFYLFRNSDIADSAMGNTGFIFTGKNSVDNNPAAMANLDKAYYYLGYNHSDYENGLDITKSKNYKSVNYFGVSSPKGGFYYRRLKKDGENIEKSRKYNFISNEIGIASVNKTSSSKGLAIGGKLKIFINELDDAKIESNELKLKREIGYGYGIDLGILYKAGVVSFALNGENILGNIYWDSYKNVYINTVVKGGIGLEYSVFKYGMSIERVIKKGTDNKYGQGVEIILINIPENYNSLFKGMSLKMRAGILSEKFMKSENSVKSYGMELSRGNYFIDMLTESGNINIFSSDDNKIYKIAIGVAY